MLHDTKTPAFDETQEGDVVVPLDAIDDFGWQYIPEGHGHYGASIQMAASAALSKPNSATGEQLTNPSTAERLTTVHEELGFYPTSLNELSRSHMLLGFRDQVGGAAKHVAEVVTHQSRDTVKTDDPVAAARSLISSFAAYARRARTDRSVLLGLQKELADSSAPQLSGANGIAITGRGQIVRYLDVKDFAEQGEGEPPLADSTVKAGFDSYIATNPSRELRKHISAVLSRKRLGEIRGVLPAAIEDQRARQTFWIQCLMDVVQHYPVLRAQASEAIRGLGQPAQGADDEFEG